MRLVVGLLTCLSLGALEPALANDPAPVGTTPAAAASSEATAAPSSGASTPATSPPAPPNGTPGSTQPGQSAPAGQAPPTGQPTTASPTAAGATTTAASKSKTPELTPAEKDLLSQGYKLEMRGTEKHFCRSQAELGTRFTHRVCTTPEQAAATKRSSQDLLNDVQRPSGNQPGK